MTDAGSTTTQAKFGRYRNPIFQRELLTLLRSRKAFALLFAYLAVSIALMLVSWPGGSASLLLQGAISREVFSVFGLTQTLLLALLIPAMIGTCMTSEKEGETIDLLLTTPVSADAILIGKLLSGLLYFLLLVLASIPILLLCFAIGGLAAQDVLGLYVLLFLQALLFGLTSVCCSTFFHRTHVAVILAYLLVGTEALVMRALFSVGVDFFSPASLISLLCFYWPAMILLYFVTRSRIRRPYNPVRKPMEEEDTRKSGGLILRHDAFPDKLVLPARRHGLMEDGANPVLHKELQAGIYGTGSLFIRLIIQAGVVLALVAYLLAMIEGLERRDGIIGLHPEYIYFCFLVGYMIIIGPSLAARTFTYEKEERTIESLFITLLPRRGIIMGKFYAILRVVAGLTLINSLPFFIYQLMYDFSLWQLLAWALVLAIVATFTTAAGMLFSMLSSTTLSAMIKTYFFLFVLYLGPLLADRFLTRLLPGLSLENIGFLTFLSPLLACRMPVYGGGEVLAFNLFVHGTISAAATLLALVVMVLSFEKLLKRQSQKLV